MRVCRDRVSFDNIVHNIAWQKENDPEEWARTKKALSVPIFLRVFTFGLVLFSADIDGNNVYYFCG